MKTKAKRFWFAAL